MMLKHEQSSNLFWQQTKVKLSKKLDLIRVEGLKIIRMIGKKIETCALLLSILINKI